MPGDFNKVVLVGRLTKDPVESTDKVGATVLFFTLATSERWRDPRNGRNRERTQFIPIFVSGKNVKVCATILAKGSLVLIEGMIITRRDADDKDVGEVYADNVQFLELKRKEDPGVTQI